MVWGLAGSYGRAALRFSAEKSTASHTGQRRAAATLARSHRALPTCPSLFLLSAAPLFPVAAVTNSRTNSRRMATSARPLNPHVREDGTRKPSQSLEDPKYHPIPRQVRQLSAVLRRQVALATAAIDTVFTLRQLHMYKQPQFHLSKVPGEQPRAERWLWRLPATSAIHAIVRRTDLESKHRGEMLRAALVLALNAIKWDSLCSAVVKTHNKQPVPRLWQLAHDVTGDQLFDQPARNACDSVMQPRNETFHSLPIETLEILIRTALRGKYGLENECLALARAMSFLGYPPFRAVTEDKLFDAALRSRRKLLATESFCRLVLSKGAPLAVKLKKWRILALALQHDTHTWKGKSSLRSIACARLLLDTLTALLDERICGQGVTYGNKAWSAESSIASALATFGSELDLSSASRRKEINVLRDTLLVDIRDQLSVVCSMYLGRTVRIQQNEIVMDTVDEQRLPPPNDSKSLYLDPSSASKLLRYAMRHEENAEFAEAFAARHIDKDGRINEPSIMNTLVQVVARTPQEAVAMIEQSKVKNDSTLPVLINMLSNYRAFDKVDDVVYGIMPELDISSSQTVSPPPVDRSPAFYLSVLRYVCLAQRVRLAERVFTQLRWASEQSRKSNIDDTDQRGKRVAGQRQGAQQQKPWAIPPSAFTMMLQLYAREVEIGRRYDARERENSTPLSSSKRFAKAWGPNAARITYYHRLMQQRGQGAADTVDDQDDSPVGPSSGQTWFEIRDEAKETAASMAMSPHGLRSVPRSELAPLAAQALLKDKSGNKQDLENFERALTSEWSKDAVQVLFGVAPTDKLRKKWAERARYGQRRVRFRSPYLQ